MLGRGYGVAVFAADSPDKQSTVLPFLPLIRVVCD
jgi:hypothetical protein